MTNQSIFNLAKFGKKLKVFIKGEEKPVVGYFTGASRKTSSEDPEIQKLHDQFELFSFKMIVPSDDIYENKDGDPATNYVNVVIGLNQILEVKLAEK